MAFNINVLNLPVIQKGSKGTAVIAWQRFLQENQYPMVYGYGEFNEVTYASTRDYQAIYELPITGVVDNATYAVALNQGLIFKVPNFSAQMLLDYINFGEAEVKDLQQALNAIAQLSPPLDVDGQFGIRSTQGLAEAYLQTDVSFRDELEQNLSTATQQKLEMISRKR